MFTKEEFATLNALGARLSSGEKLTHDERQKMLEQIKKIKSDVKAREGT